VGCEAFDLTRRRGDAEEDAEKSEKRRELVRGILPMAGVVRGDSGEHGERCPSFARMDRDPEGTPAYPTWLGGAS
jgi:hypothetical protein